MEKNFRLQISTTKFVALCKREDVSKTSVRKSASGSVYLVYNNL